MSNIDKLLEYQKEDEKLIKIEQQIANSEARKRYMQSKNFLIKASEQLDRLEAKATDLMAQLAKLNQSSDTLEEELKDFENLDEMVQEGADVSFYKKSAVQLSDKLKSVKGEINALTQSIKDVDADFRALKKKVIAAQTQFKDSQEAYRKLKEAKRREAAETEKTLAAIGAQLNADTLAKYKAKRNERIFPIVCPVRADRCSKCGMELSIAGKESLSSGQFIECENCHRVLYKE